MPSKGKKTVANAKPATSGAGLGGRGSKFWLAAGAIGLVAAIVLQWNLAGDNPASAASDKAGAATTSQPGNTTASSLAGTTGSGSGPLTPEQKAQQILDAQKQLTLAQHTYNTYKQGTQYPQESRPISEHPDQVYPNQPVADEHALRKTDGKIDPTIKIKTTQSRIFVGSRENVVFSISAVDSNGKTLPVFVNKAVARAAVRNGQRELAPISLGFTDDGSGADASAGDGVFSASMNPSATGLANFNGTIRTEVNFNVNDSNGFVLFDFVYTPEVPATWTGQVRDVLENGSLSFYLKANINQAGRYLVSGRVDDASGKPFALVSFNDILPAGSVDIKLPVFGKLIVDQKPVFPLTLRDVNAYLLKEDTDPDRALMPRLAGPVLVSKKYPLASFSSAEWDSEERKRYLTELAKDVDQAKAALAQLGH
jgi:hypothetical protein